MALWLPMGVWKALERIWLRPQGFVPVGGNGVLEKARVMENFGRMIAGRRKEFKMSQKDVAARIKKEDGQAISVQYLNDVEHGRRKAPSDLIIRQLAKILKLPLDALYFSAARLPPDIKIDKIEPERAAAAYKAFRRELKDKGEKK